MPDPVQRLIVVCPLHALEGTIARSRPDHVVSIHSPGASVPALDVAHHTVVVHHDVVNETEPQPGLVHPAPEHARAIVDAALAWDRKRPLLIHCQLGISRSPAAAIIAAAALDPVRDEREIAASVREAAPFATPNIRLIAAADAVLGREGRLTDAVRSIGRGAFGAAFSLTT